MGLVGVYVLQAFAMNSMLSYEVSSFRAEGKGNWLESCGGCCTARKLCSGLS